MCFWLGVFGPTDGSISGGLYSVMGISRKIPKSIASEKKWVVDREDHNGLL